jgi:iron(III) transport system substrate-binding protein
MRLSALFLTAAGAALLAGCSAQEGADAGGSGEVNLYSARHYDSDQPLYDRFTKETGIKINLIDAKADELIARMKAEGQSSPADLFITADAGALFRAQQAGLFQPVTSAALTERVPAALRDPDNNWYGFSRRARVVAYDAAKVKPEEVDDFAKLAGPRFKGKICVRSSDSVYNLSLVGAAIEQLGKAEADKWVRGIVANMARPPEGGDRDQIRAVGAGVCEVAITNSYYYIRMASGDDAADRAVTDKVKLAFTGLGGKGAHVNISGGGVAKHAPNRANAIKLLEFFASAETQQHIAKNNNEFPATPGVTAPPPVDAYAGFTANPMPVAVFAKRQAEAQSLMSAAGWR